MTEATITACRTPSRPPVHTPKAKGPLGAIYNWVIRLAGGKHAEPALFASPSPKLVLPDSARRDARADVLRPARTAYRYAIVCTIASVLGGMLGYALGFFLSNGWLTHLAFRYAASRRPSRVLRRGGRLGHPHQGRDAHSLQAGDHRLGPLAFNLPIFIAASVVTRGFRFFLVAWLFKTFGPTLAPIIEKRIGLFMLLFVVILIGGFVPPRC